MTDLDIAVDLSVLESLDFPVPCGHSQHDHADFTHDGPAEFIAVSYHDCPVKQEQIPYYYPCCATWAAYVVMNGRLGRSIICSRCGQQGEWAEFVTIIDKLT
jgi:hypothetical protein